MKAFKKALEDAGADVVVKHTLRTPEAAYLWHWAWKIAQRKARPTDPPPHRGIDIQWDHGVLADSIKGAEEMVDRFELVHQPSLNTLHKFGRAIDMNIIWTGTIQVMTKGGGTPVDVPYMINVNANRALHEVGESYGVVKLKSDRVHWSDDGN